MPALVTELIVPRRFNGPPSSGNGGWVTGALAGTLALEHEHADAGDAPHAGVRAPGDRADAWPTVEVSLRQPPPLDTPLHVACDGDGVVATFGGAVIGSARPVDHELATVEGVDPERARAASAGFPGLRQHLFPTCFGCGPERAEGDGLRVFGGPLDGSPDGFPDGSPDGPDGRDPRIAAPWTPHPSHADHRPHVDEAPVASLASTWAALDCIGGWAGDMAERLMVLARMTARVDALPVIGEEHVLVAVGRGREGRKTFTASTLHDSDGRVVATAEHLWIAIDPRDFT